MIGSGASLVLAAASAIAGATTVAAVGAGIASAGTAVATVYVGAKFGLESNAFVGAVGENGRRDVSFGRGAVAGVEAFFEVTQCTSPLGGLKSLAGHMWRNQLGKAAVGAAHGAADVYMQSRMSGTQASWTDYVSGAGLRAYHGGLDTTSRTYASAAGAALGAGAAAAFEGDARAVYLASQTGGMIGGFGASARDGWLHKRSVHDFRMMVGAEALGGIGGGVAGYMATGTWEGALQGASHGMMVSSAIARMYLACFTGETKLYARGAWGEGWRRIDAIATSDEVLSRDEHDATGPLAWKRVEETFARTAAILAVRVNGHIIRTTAEHPFFVANCGTPFNGAGFLAGRI